jgi:hypothetical protein
MDMNMKTAVLTLIIVITALLIVSQSASAQSSQVSNAISLSHLNVQLTYPAQAMPGKSITVGVQAMAKDNFNLEALTVQVYLTDQSANNLRQLTNATLVKNLPMYAGDQIRKNIEVPVPSNAPRTSLIGIVTENATTVHTYYERSPSSQPLMTIYYTATSDQKIAPLTYVVATTPEYMALQSQFQALQSNFIQLQQTLNETKTNLQNTISQQSTSIDQLNQQLVYANRRTQTYQILALGLGILAAALAVYGVHLKRTGKVKQKTILAEEAKQIH